MIKLIDFIGCISIVLAELIGILLVLIVVQAICYRVFKFNPFMWIIKKLNKLERRIQKWNLNCSF